MISLLAALFALGPSSGPTVPPGEPVLRTSGAPIRVWMSNNRLFREGDQVRVQVDADADGFLLVLNYDADGRIRVLFPLDPRDDASVQAGRRYELRDEEGRGAFRAGRDGTGLVYSAISRDPWRFDEIVLADRWDYSRLEIDRRSENPERDLTDLVQRLAGPGGFDYDVLGYRVYGGGSYSYGRYTTGPVYVYDDYLFCNSWYWRYNGCRRWPFDGGWFLGLGYYDPFYYGYYPYGYGYYPYGGYNRGYYPYFPSYPYRPGVGRQPVVVNRPRGYTAQPATLGNDLGRPGRVVPGTSRSPTSTVTPPPINWRPRAPARPAREAVGRDAPDARGPATSVNFPPARRARNEGVTYPGSGGRGEQASRGGNRDDGGRSAPRNDPPSHAPPPPRSVSGSGGGGGGAHPSSGGGGGGGGGGHSRPRRP